VSPDELPATFLLKPGEVARIFGVRTSTITRWAREGKLPYLTTAGGHRRYRRPDVQALLPADQTDLQEQAELDAARLYDQGWSAT
jgi:excisionase family DNA binding protein